MEQGQGRPAAENATIWRTILGYAQQLFDLREDTDKKGTIESINKYILIKGYNVWILIASAMLASIGLDMNSTAVIIGAMLVSPLMSPILGIGLSIGINDRQTLLKSLQNFLVAIIGTVLASVLYFKLTPLGNTTSEIMARTQPTLLDVGVAFFGGVAGIVASSHKDKTNALPGVAIATALMPPLCVVGFGLAKGMFSIWLGALYLFFINATIIAFTTYVFVRVLDFPVKKYMNPAEQRKTNLFIGTFVVLLIIPSIIILLNTLDELTMARSINDFVERHVNDGKREAINWEMEDKDSIAYVKVFLAGESLSPDTVPKLQRMLRQYLPKKDSVNLQLVQMNVSQREKERLTGEITGEVQKILLEVNHQLDEQRSQLENIAALQQRANHLQLDSSVVASLGREIKAMYPEVVRLGVSKLQETVYNDTSAQQIRIPFFEIEWDKKLADKDIAANQTRIGSYLKVRLGYDSLRLVRYVNEQRLEN